MNKYPRPQLKRNSFFSLNGNWIMNDEEIFVPSCRQEKHLVYEKRFDHIKSTKRVILHFSAVDQIARVYLNDTYLGEHKGGYLPFEFEISEQIREHNKLIVEVIDELNVTYPYGKQSLDPKGMWYTAVSGIWGDVWYEEVPLTYIKNIKITPDLKGVDLDILVDDNKTLKKKHIRKDIEDAKLWDIDHPYLYKEKIKVADDEVEIYFGLRTVDIQKINGINRVCLNNKPLFFNGLLDQGYWKDTLFIPNSENGYRKDISAIKALGFNTLRKHIKIEPEEFYYECDKAGILVIQDMVQNGPYSFIRDTALPTVGFNKKDIVKNIDERMTFFIKHSEETIEHLYSHPSVVAYTIFNEGWGQFNSDELYTRFKALDKTRLFDSTSGWFKQKNSDFDSVHVYFRNKHLDPDDKPMFLSECGGYVYALGSDKAKWGYGICKSEKDLTDRIIQLYETMVIPALKQGLCGVIYTQVSDVEGELNGLFSFDRKHIKINKKQIIDLNKKINEIFKKV